MPFTFSHPALVLPFFKVPAKYLSLTGLMIGSTLPDFEYFLRLRFVAEIGHSLHGIVLFCLPLGYFLCFAYHVFIRNALIKHSPLFLRKRFWAYTAFNWVEYEKKHRLVVIVSICLGTGSHIFLDAFTHSDGFFVGLIPALQYVISPLKMPVYHFLQIVLSFLGMGILWIGLMLHPKGSFEKQEKRPSDFIIGYGLLFVGFFALFFYLGTHYSGIKGFVLPGISSGLISLLLTSIFLSERNTVP